MTIAFANLDHVTRSVRILCVGDHVAPLLEVQYHLDADFDFVIVGCSDEGIAALSAEAPFDVIINDCDMQGVGGEEFLERLHAHSPDAERLILAPRTHAAARAMAARDGRVMRLLNPRCPAEVLREAVADALLRHRARALRAASHSRATASADYRSQAASR